MLNNLKNNVLKAAAKGIQEISVSSASKQCSWIAYEAKIPAQLKKAE